MALTDVQRRFLRAQAHSLRPVVQIGQSGVTPSLCDAIRQALFDHELIKVKYGQSYPGQAREDAPALAKEVDAEVCQIIGRVLVLYRRRNPPVKGKPTVDLS